MNYYLDDPNMMFPLGSSRGYRVILRNSQTSSTKAIKNTKKVNKKVNKTEDEVFYYYLIHFMTHLMAVFIGWTIGCINVRIV